MTKITGVIGVTVLATVFLQTAMASDIKIPYQCQKIDGVKYCIGGSGFWDALKHLDCIDSDVYCVDSWAEAYEIAKKRKEK